MVLIRRGHRPDREVSPHKAVVLPAGERLAEGEDLAARLLGDQIDPVVVVVVVGDKDQVGRQIISLPGKGIQIQHHPPI